MAGGDLPLMWIRLLAVACHAAAVVLTWRLARVYVGAYGSLAAAAIIGLHPALLQQHLSVLSESAFIPLALAALVAIEVPSREGRFLRRAVMAGLFSGAAILVRTMGMALIPACLLGIGLQRGVSARRKSLGAVLYLTLSCLPMATWQARQAGFEREYGYSDMWTRARSVEATDATGIALQVRRLLVFGPARMSDMLALFVPTYAGWRLYSAPFVRPAGAAITLACGVCCMALLWRRRSPAATFATLSLAMVAVWPWNEGVRLVLPAAPILVVAAIVTARDALVRGGAGARLAGMAAGLLLLSSGANIVDGALAWPRRLDASRTRSLAAIEEMKGMAAWMSASLPSESRIVCITRQGDSAKTLLAGAAYLADVPIAGYRDLAPDAPVELPEHCKSRDFLFVQRCLLRGKEPEASTVGQFAVLPAVP